MKKLNDSAIQDKVMHITTTYFTYAEVCRVLRIVDGGTIDLITQLEIPLQAKFKSRVIRFRRDRTYI